MAFLLSNTILQVSPAPWCIFRCLLGLLWPHSTVALIFHRVPHATSCSNWKEVPCCWRDFPGSHRHRDYLSIPCFTGLVAPCEFSGLFLLSSSKNLPSTLRLIPDIHFHALWHMNSFLCLSRTLAPRFSFTYHCKCCYYYYFLSLLSVVNAALKIQSFYSNLLLFLFLFSTP